MAVVYYQLFILATLVVVRVVFPTRLLLAALVWSGATIVNLFYPPLIVVQLVVIWGGFALLNTRRASVTPSEAAAGAASGDNGSVREPVQHTKCKEAGPGPLAEARDALETEREIRAVLAPFQTALHKERAYITSAIEASKSKLEYRRRLLDADPDKRAQLEQIRASLEEVIRTVSRDERYTIDELECMDLTPPSHLLNPKVAGSVKIRLERMLDGQAKFLAETSDILRRDAELRPILAATLQEMGGSDLLNRIKAYEANLEWRSAAGLAEAARLPATSLIPLQGSAGGVLRTESMPSGGVSPLKPVSAPRSIRIKIEDRDEKIFETFTVREIIAQFEVLRTPKDGLFLPGGANVHLHRLRDEDDYCEELAAYEPLTAAQSNGGFWVRRARKARWRVSLAFEKTYGQACDRHVTLSSSVKDHDSWGSPVFSSGSYKAEVTAKYLDLWFNIPSDEVVRDLKDVINQDPLSQN